MLPDIAKMGEIRLERVNSAFESIYPLSSLLGPPVAGILIVWLSASNVLWLDAASFGISALLVFVGIPATVRGATAPKRGRYVDDLREGISFLRRDHLLLAMAAWIAVSNFLLGPLFGVVLPVYARDVFHSARDFGLMLAAYGAGQMCGSLGYGVIGGRLPRRALWLTGFICATIPFLVLAWRPTLPIIMIGMALSALTDGPLTPLSVTIRHEHTPPQLRGRVFSTFSAISTMAVPLGMAATGLLIGSIGRQHSVLILGAIGVLMAASAVVAPVFRQMNQLTTAASTDELMQRPS